MTIARELKLTLDHLHAEVVSPDGRSVDYEKLRSSSTYQRYLALKAGLSAFNPSTLTTRDEKLAFWINLYNVLILDAVLKDNVRVSVTEGWIGFATFFARASTLIDGKKMSCNDIEHGILRANKGFPSLPYAQFRANDPRRAWVIDPAEVRIHFALNCASRSCPPVRFYDPANLNSQLDVATHSFVQEETSVNTATGIVTLSKLFEWYAGDFVTSVQQNSEENPVEGSNASQREPDNRQADPEHQKTKLSILRFIMPYLLEQDQAWLNLHADTVKLKYAPYDWRLNRVL